MTDTPWIRVYAASNSIEAEVVAAALKHHGLNVQLRPATPTGFGAALPTLDQPPTLWVPADEAEEAHKIIETATTDHAQSETGRLSLPTDDGE